VVVVLAQVTVLEQVGLVVKTAARGQTETGEHLQGGCHELGFQGLALGGKLVPDLLGALVILGGQKGLQHRQAVAQAVHALLAQQALELTPFLIV
jgi:hypothetical protein